MERYCPACAGLLRARAIDGARRLVCVRCRRVHYANPKAAVAAAIVRGGAVLLSRRARAPKRGWWDLPGGFLEVGESAEQGLARELREELGVRLRAARLVGTWPGRYQGAWTLSLVYACEVRGAPAARDDVAEVRWFPLARPPARMAFAHERAALRLVRGAPRSRSAPRRAAGRRSRSA